MPVGHERINIGKDLPLVPRHQRHQPLAAVGFGGLGLTVDDFSAPGKIVQMGIAPNRIDLLTAIDGVSFGDAWLRRVPGHFGTEAVDYISVADLIRNKRASARPQDLLDVEDLSSGD